MRCACRCSRRCESSALSSASAVGTVSEFGGGGGASPHSTSATGCCAASRRPATRSTAAAAHAARPTTTTTAVIAVAAAMIARARSLVANRRCSGARARRCSVYKGRRVYRSRLRQRARNDDAVQPLQSSGLGRDRVAVRGRAHGARRLAVPRPARHGAQVQRRGQAALPAILDGANVRGPVAVPAARHLVDDHDVLQRLVHRSHHADAQAPGHDGALDEASHAPHARGAHGAARAAHKRDAVARGLCRGHEPLRARLHGQRRDAADGGGPGRLCARSRHRRGGVRRHAAAHWHHGHYEHDSLPPEARASRQRSSAERRGDLQDREGRLGCRARQQGPRLARPARDGASRPARGQLDGRHHSRGHQVAHYRRRGQPRLLPVRPGRAPQRRAALGRCRYARRRRRGARAALLRPRHWRQARAAAAPQARDWRSRPHRHVRAAVPARRVPQDHVDD